MDWKQNAGTLAVAAILLVAGVLMVTVLDDAPDGPQEIEAEDEPGPEDEEANASPGDVDLVWWTGAGAIVLGVVMGVWAVVDTDEDEGGGY